MLPLKNIFNKIFWDSRVDKQDYIITFVHRGAPSDEKTIPAFIIKRVGKSWFSYEDQGEETIIPMHRVITVKNTKTGAVLWRKRTHLS
jgi:uncharacterized protein (UPF0248 family)